MSETPLQPPPPPPSPGGGDLRRSTLVVLAVALLACQGSLRPAPVPPPDVVVPGDASPTIDAPEDVGDDGDMYDRACARLATLGCKDGLHPACAMIMRRADLDNLVRMNSSCVASAASVEAVRKCGQFCRVVVR